MKDLKQIKSTLQTKTAELSNLLQTFQSLQQDVDTYISETQSPQLCYVKGVINGQNNNDPVMVFSCNALDEFLATSDLPLPIKRYPPPPPNVIGRRPSTVPREYKRPLVWLSFPELYFYFMHYTSKRGACGKASAARQALDGQPRENPPTRT